MNQLIESLMLVQRNLDTLSDKIFKHIFRVFSEIVYLSKLDLRKSITMENLWITMVTSFWILSLRLLAFPFVFHLFKEIWTLFFFGKKAAKIKDFNWTYRTIAEFSLDIWFSLIFKKVWNKDFF